MKVVVRCEICGKREMADPPTQSARPGNELVWLCDSCEQISVDRLGALGLKSAVTGNVRVWEGDEEMVE